MTLFLTGCQVVSKSRIFFCRGYHNHRSKSPKKPMQNTTPMNIITPQANCLRHDLWLAKRPEEFGIKFGHLAARVKWPDKTWPNSPKRGGEGGSGRPKIFVFSSMGVGYVCISRVIKRTEDSPLQGALRGFSLGAPWRRAKCGRG